MYRKFRNDNSELSIYLRYPNSFFTDRFRNHSWSLVHSAYILFGPFKHRNAINKDFHYTEKQFEIYHTVNRLRSFLSPNHSVSWSLGHLVTQSLSHSVTQSLSHSVTRSLGHSVTRSLGHSVTRSLGHSVTQSLSHSVTRSLGHSVSRSLGHSVTRSLSHYFQHWY